MNEINKEEENNEVLEKEQKETIDDSDKELKRAMMHRFKGK